MSVSVSGPRLTIRKCLHLGFEYPSGSCDLLLRSGPVDVVPSTLAWVGKEQLLSAE